MKKLVIQNITTKTKMSHINNDRYNEDLQEAEQDVKDLNEVYIQASEDLDEAIKWKAKIQADYQQAFNRLEALKNYGK